PAVPIPGEHWPSFRDNHALRPRPTRPLHRPALYEDRCHVYRLGNKTYRESRVLDDSNNGRRGCKRCGGWPLDTPVTLVPALRCGTPMEHSGATASVGDLQPIHTHHPRFPSIIKPSA